LSTITYNRKRQERNAQDPVLKDRFKNYPGAYVPQGSNNIGSKDSFEERLYYREAALQQLSGQEEGLKDFWIDSPWYGIVNPDGFVVYPSSTLMKQITSSRESVFALNFVVDAFEEMASYCEKYVSTAPNLFSRNASAVVPLAATRGWESPRKAYARHMEDLYDAFTNGYLENRGSKIIYFEDFLEHMLSFLNFSTPIFTFSTFIRSKLASRFVSGLTLEIKGPPYGDDASKFQQIYADSKFELYRQAAQIHGFHIDKNIPSRLYANIDHPRMKEKIKKDILFVNEYSFDSFFKNAYYLAHREDIEYLKFHMALMYNTYAGNFPSVDATIKNKKTGCPTKKKRHFRQMLDAFSADGKLKKESKYSESYGDMFWIRFYYKMKMRECAVPVTEKQCNKKLRTYYDMYRTRGMEATTDAIISDVLREMAKRDQKNQFLELKTTGRVTQSLLSSTKRQSPKPQAASQVSYATSPAGTTGGTTGGTMGGGGY